VSVCLVCLGCYLLRAFLRALLGDWGVLRWQFALLESGDVDDDLEALKKEMLLGDSKVSTVHVA